MEIIRHHFSTIDSTNDYSLQNVLHFNPEKITLITADQQQKGRGRNRRTWFSPQSKNIYASFSFFFPDHQKDIGNLSQLLTISACQVLHTWGLQPTIKWPNDILISHKKIAGILCEVKRFGTDYFIVDGIGLNVNMTKEELARISHTISSEEGLTDRSDSSRVYEKSGPTRIGQAATSMSEEIGQTIDHEKVLQDLQKKFTENLDTFRNNGFASFLIILSKFMHPFFHQEIQFRDVQRLWNGSFHSLNEDGSLNLQLASGELKRFYSGEFNYHTT